MSLAIDTNKVEQVLLADGWHPVWWPDVSSFSIDSYEFTQTYETFDGKVKELDILMGGQCEGIVSTGFSFIENDETHGKVITGPLTSVLALRMNYE